VTADKHEAAYHGGPDNSGIVPPYILEKLAPSALVCILLTRAEWDIITAALHRGTSPGETLLADHLDGILNPTQGTIEGEKTHGSE
jgi:hypothetical protein